MTGSNQNKIEKIWNIYLQFASLLLFRIWHDGPKRNQTSTVGGGGLKWWSKHPGSLDLSRIQRSKELLGKFGAHMAHAYVFLRMAALTKSNKAPTQKMISLKNLSESWWFTNLIFCRELRSITIIDDLNFLNFMEKLTVFLGLAPRWVSASQASHCYGTSSSWYLGGWKSTDVWWGEIG